MKRAGLLLLAARRARRRRRAVAGAEPARRRLPGSLYAPPTAVHLFRRRRRGRRSSIRSGWSAGSSGGSRRTRSQPVPLRWFTDGRLVTVPEADGGPLLLLGADGFGRDTFSRLLYGARASLGAGGRSPRSARCSSARSSAASPATPAARSIDVLSRFTDFVLVLPAIYVALALRAVMPLVLPPATVFVLLGGIFALLGWPIVARGVRAIVASERERDYAVAGRALGAAPCASADAPSAAGGRRLPRGAGHAAAAGVHPGRGDAVVRRPRLSRHGADVGHDAAGGGERRAARRCAVDARAGRGDFRRRARA